MIYFPAAPASYELLYYRRQATSHVFTVVGARGWGGVVKEGKRTDLFTGMKLYLGEHF